MQPHALTFLTFTPQVGIPQEETVSNNTKKNLLPLNALHIHILKREKNIHAHTNIKSHRTFTTKIYYGSHVRVFNQCVCKSKKKEREIPSQKSRRKFTDGAIKSECVLLD